jgi:DNA mismatch endonuclease (patch repair protein)
MTRGPQFFGLKPSSKTASLSKSRNPSIGTLPELILRRALSELGVRYRLHSTSLPGKPDIVFARVRVAIFVDGDFWHGRNWQSRKKKLSVGSNSEYWVEKIRANRARDRAHTQKLRKSGWTVIRVWETDVKREPEKTALTIARVVEQRARGKL